MIQVVGCEPNDNESTAESDESCDSVVFRENVFQESPHEDGAKAEEDSTGGAEM